MKTEIFKFLTIFWIVFGLLLIPIFFIGFACFRSTGNLTIIGIVFTLAIIGLAGAITTLITKNNQRKNK